MTAGVKRTTAALVALVLVIGVAVAYAKWGRRALPEGLIQANGRIEGDHVSVASKFAGRVQELRVREGAAVRAGQALIVLDDAQVTARVSQARAQLAQAAARVEREMEDMFGRPLRWPWGDGERGWAPAVDMIDRKDEIVLRADLPGLDEKDIEVTVQDG